MSRRQGKLFKLFVTAATEYYKNRNIAKISNKIKREEIEEIDIYTYLHDKVQN